jgi:hypothetical protein
MINWADLLTAAEAIRADAAAEDSRLGALRITGVGWATVDVDRALAELGAVLDGPARWLAEARDPLLGASVRRRDPAPGTGPALFVLEPDTEGRLAAALARFGEGVAVAYLAGGGEASRIVAINPRWGPYVVVRSRSG